MPREPKSTGCAVSSCVVPRCKNLEHAPCPDYHLSLEHAPGARCPRCQVLLEPIAPATSRTQLKLRLDLREKCALKIYAGAAMTAADAFMHADRFIEEVRAQRKKRDTSLLEQIAKETGDGS